MKCVPKYLKSSFIIFLGVMGLSQPSGADGPSLSKLCVVDETLSNSDSDIASEDNQGRQRNGFDETVGSGNPRKNIFDAIIRALKKNPAEAPNISVKLGDCLEMRLELSGHRFSSEAEGFDNLIAELTDSPLSEEQRLSDFQTFHSSTLSFSEFVGKKDSINTLEKLEKRGFDVEVTQPRYNTSLKDALLKLILEKRGRPFIVKCNDPQTVEGPIRLEQTVSVKVARSDIFVGSVRLVYTANAKATFTCIVGGPNCCNTTEIVDEVSRREREGAPCADDMVISQFKEAIQPFNKFKDKYDEYPICRDTGKTMSDLPAITFVNTREEANAFIQAKKAQLAQEFCTKPCAGGQCKPFAEAAIIEIPQRAGGGDDIDALRGREDIDRGAGLLGYNDTTAARFMADQRNKAERQGNSRNGNILASVVDFECICCGVSAATPLPSGPQDQPGEEGGTLIGPTPTEEEGVEAPPTGDIGPGGGAGGAGSAPGEIQKNVTSHACMVATGSEPAFPSMAGSGFSFLQDVVIDDATPDAIGITTKAIDTVNLEFLDANGNRVLGGQSRRPNPPQIQSIFPRDLSGNILRDSAGNIVEIVLRSISRDRIELQIPSELGRISPVKQLTLFILRDSAAGGFKVEPNQVPGVGLICHLGF